MTREENEMTDDLDPRELLGRSLDQSARMIAHVAPAQMSSPTPCTEFDVRALIGHMLFAANRIGAAGRRQQLAQDGPTVAGLGDEEWSAAFAKSADEAVSAWAAPEALEGEINLPFGTFPAGVVVGIYALEQATHAWDLASATGSTAELDPALAEAVFPIATRMVPTVGRDSDDFPFDAVVDVPADAPVYDRLAGYLGRKPMTPVTAERADLLAALGNARRFLRFTVRDLSDDQARERTTASELYLGGVVKHVSEVEKRWANFIVEGPSAMSFTGGQDERRERHDRGFHLGEGETLASVLDAYAEVAERTDELVSTIDLDAEQPLPEAPWFPPGARWSGRRVILHVIAETSQHAGHADIIRETLDGQKTMG